MWSTSYRFELSSWFLKRFHPSVHPSDPDTMTNTDLEVTASSSSNGGAQAARGPDQMQLQNKQLLIENATTRLFKRNAKALSLNAIADLPSASRNDF